MCKTGDFHVSIEGPKRLVDVTGDETVMTFCGMPPKQTTIMAWIGEAGDRAVVLRPGFQNMKRLFTIFVNHTGPLVVNIGPRK